VTARIGPPADKPCPSCPYRRDVPSGVWAAEEYDKLPGYDGDTMSQRPAVFLCHQLTGRVCAGWAGSHDMGESLALRVAACAGTMTGEAIEATLDYTSPVALFASGAEACAHGLAELTSPSREAVEVGRRITRKRQYAHANPTTKETHDA
jgi:Family of unknown function (DUF6283)